MPLTGDELLCPKFQPNIFDSTRCHDCLRQKHLHNTCSSAERAPEQTAARSDDKDTSAKDDSDVLSVVSSYCDVSRGGRGFEDSSLCILSPDCDLYLCDGDDDQSSDSQGDDSVYSSSAGTEEYSSSLLHHPSSCRRMTRLDPPPHRTSPRGWTEVSQSHRDGFGQFGFSHGSVKERRERESGYFSLGRAAGSRAFRDQSPPAPYRHSERGHPLPSNKSPEPKATIPFRNPDLGVPSERRTSEFQNAEQLEENYPPDPVDLSLEVEALAGPRALSPTPFKQAESFGGSGRRGGRNAHTSPLRQSGTLNSPQRGSGLSRSSSPSRSTSPFRRAESSSSLNTVGFRSSGVSHGQDRAPVSPAWNSYSGILRSFASTAGTVSSINKSLSHMDLRGTLRKPETNSSFVGSAENRGSSSPSRRSYEGPAVRKTETKSPSYERGHDRQSAFSSVGRYDSRSSSPSRRSYDSPAVRKTETKSPSYERGHDRQGFSSSSLKSRYDSRSQSPKGRPETNGSSTQIQEGRRSASPVRKGYGTPSQSDRRSISNGWSHDRKSPSPSRKSYEMQSQATMKKTEAKSSLHSYNRDSRLSSPSRGHHQNPGLSSLRKSETSQSSSNRGPKSRSTSPTAHSQSPPRKSDLQMSTLRREITEHVPLRNTMSDRTGSSSYVRNATSNQSQHDSSGRWRGSTHSLHSQSVSRNSSPSRHSSEKKPIGSFTKSASVAWETPRDGGKRSSVRQNQEAQNSTSNSRRAQSRHRSPSPPVQRHTSSQSSMDSESSHLSAGSSGLNREEYAMMADLPKVKTVFQREGPSHLRRMESTQKRELSRYKPASHSQSKAPHSEWDELEDDRDSGTLSRAHSSSSLHTQRASSPAAEQMQSGRNPSRASGQNQPDLLNFKKGWMSKLDESGEWRKHWFVLTDAGLKYYRDSAAEERDEVDGEIDLKSCVKVSEFDVEKNYGFQIQTRDAVFTLSAMTAGIRRNWIEVLRKNVRPGSSPDLTQLPNCSSNKENSRHSSSLRLRSQSEASSGSANPAHSKFDYVELSPVTTPATPASANQRESGEGQVREHSQWQEERPRDDAHNQWEAVLSRKGTGQLSEQRRIEEEIEKKWAEFERLPLKETRSLPSMGSRSSPSANQALEREVASLRQQLVELRAGQGGREGWAGRCGAESGCGEMLRQMERAHKEALEELEKQHAQQISALERERDTLLKEETDATARVMEALQKAHREELEKTAQLRETHGMDSHTFDKQQQAEVASLRRELQALSERYSQKCLELKRVQQQSLDTHRLMSQKDTQMEQLKKDNQVLLRVRENELQYLHKQLNSLRNQLHFLTTEKSSVCERYREVCEELSAMKSRSEREAETLREHLRLALSALHEGQQTDNTHARTHTHAS
ncbi:serine arginine repetitive matrix 2-like protein [Labeo rohita]|uniref:Serine arginine repetitive matrix 2-like protein n=1 Tax=Labeo rohita TaxID=84645 RepID=A0A498MHD8_LABRO|nr:serine arginine repetitive matrix 2-like protein [Labeo rohita]